MRSPARGSPVDVMMTGALHAGRFEQSREVFGLVDVAEALQDSEQEQAVTDVKGSVAALVLSADARPPGRISFRVANVQNLL
jgi:hypothetical protein